MPARASSSRSPRGSGSQLIETLQESITSLLAENRRLKNQLDRLQEHGRSSSEPIGRQLAALTRRVARAVEGGRGQAKASTRRAPQKRTRRPITDPAVLERRRAALAKAREVRAARRAASASEGAGS